MRTGFSFMLGAVGSIVGAPALAQANFTAMVIGNTVGSMSGDAGCYEGRGHQYSETAHRKLQSRAEVTLQNYLRLAGTGTAVDLRPLFTPEKFLAKKSSRTWTDDVRPIWTHDGRSGNVAAVGDPLARAFVASGAPFDTMIKLEQFFIAGDKYSTVGIWRVIAPDDPKNVIGRYRIRFFRHNIQDTITWDLLAVELFSGEAQPAKIIKFCRKPGDVEQYLADREKAKAERARRKASRESAARQ